MKEEKKEEKCEKCTCPGKRLSKDEIMIIAEKIAKSNCSAVCITGGEPMKCVYLPDILEVLHRDNNHLQIFLSTNGVAYKNAKTNMNVETEGRVNKRMIETIERNINKLSFPLDGVGEDSKINGRDNFDQVKYILDTYKDNKYLNYAFTVKIGTLVTKRILLKSDEEIKAHFQKIKDFVDKYPGLNWEIYQFLPRGSGKDHEMEFECSNEAFEQLKVKLSEIVPCRFFSSRDDRDSAYFVVRYDGSVICPIDKDSCIAELEVGNMLKDSLKDIRDRWDGVAAVDCCRAMANCRKGRERAGSVSLEERILLVKISETPLDISRLTDEEKEKTKKLLKSRAIKYITPQVKVNDFNLEKGIVNLRYEGVAPKRRIIEMLRNHPETAWVAECAGPGDECIFRVCFFTKNSAKIIDDLEEGMSRGVFRWVKDEWTPYTKTMLEGHYGNKITKDDYLQLVAIKSLSHGNLEDIIRYSGGKDLEELDKISMTGFNKAFTALKKLNVNEEIPKLKTLGRFKKNPVELEIKEISSIGDLDNPLIEKFHVVLDYEIMGESSFISVIRVDGKNRSFFGTLKEKAKTIPEIVFMNCLSEGKANVFIFDVKINSDNEGNVDGIIKELMGDVKYEKAEDTICILFEHKYQYLNAAIMKGVWEKVKGE